MILIACSLICLFIGLVYGVFTHSSISGVIAFSVIGLAIPPAVYLIYSQFRKNRPGIKEVAESNETQGEEVEKGEFQQESMSTPLIQHEQNITPEEASSGTTKKFRRNGKTLEVTIPPGVKTGTVVRLTGALKITDGRDGDIHIKVNVSSNIQGNWFQQHLNWTFILSLALFYGLTYGSSFITGFLMVINDPYVSYDSLGTAGILVNVVLGLLFLLPISAWILDQKGRSFWFLLVLFIPFGLVIFLCIENRRNTSALIDKADLSANRKKINGKWVFGLSSAVTGIVATGAAMIFFMTTSVYHEPLGIVEWDEIKSNETYWNVDWNNRYEELVLTCYEIADNYYQSHTYIPDETDCNDMAVDIWSRT